MTHEHARALFHFKTKRLLLTGHSLDNAALLNQWVNDPELAYATDDSPPDQPETLAETKEYLETIQANNRLDGNRIDYAIRLGADNRCIGFGQIVRIDRYNKHCLLSIIIGDTSQRQKGYAAEALRQVIAVCFGPLGLHRVGAEIFSFNTPSIRLFESLGFVREGVKRESVWKKGRFADECSYSLLRPEWRHRQ